jgi:hypothetical protein
MNAQFRTNLPANHVVNLFEENGPLVLLRSIENAFKQPFQAEPTAQQDATTVRT